MTTTTTATGTSTPFTRASNFSVRHMVVSKVRGASPSSGNIALEESGLVPRSC